MFGVEDRFPAPDRFFDASDQLHELVAHEIGSNDFGPADYLLPLRLLMESMDYDPHFSRRGRTVAWGMLIMALGSCAIAFREMNKAVGFGKTPIVRPVVITGLHRTGTTALHKLLHVDPRFQGLEGWLIGSPMPRPPRDTWEAHPLFKQMSERLDARFAGAAGMKIAHDMSGAEVDECVGILAQGFNSSFWSSAWSASTCDAWRQGQSDRASYAYYRQCLQLIGSNDPDNRWLLKNPAHLGSLAMLFETLPDVLVIQTHRDPAKAVPSLCSLLMTNHSMMEEGRLDQRARTMGYCEVSRAARAIRGAEPVREARRDQILDVQHIDFHRDPMNTIRKIYPFIGLELTPEIEMAMEQRIAAAPQAAHGTHRYSASDYGLAEDEIREQFGDYLDRFDLLNA